MNSPTPVDIPALTFTPIGTVHTPMRTKFDAPSQPEADGEQKNTVELLPGHNFEQALRDLEGFERIWLISWFHRNSTWRPMVRPPRGKSLRRGVFSTRSPHRPNPIGITSVALHSINGLTLTIGSCDLVDGTPILDIKPYIDTVDSFPGAAKGWLAEVEQIHAELPKYTVTFTEHAQAQLSWLAEHFAVELQHKVTTILSRDPSPHRTRRIMRYSPTLFRIACGPWRLFYTVSDTIIVVERVGRGFKDADLHRENYQVIPDRDAQVAFAAKWE